MLAPAMNTPDTETPRQRDVQRRFDRSADDSDAAEFLFATSRAGLLERLQPMQLKVERVLILGAGKGALNRELGKRFRGSQLFGLDLSHNMLQHNRRAGSLFSRNRVLQANAQAIPLKDGSMDVVIANLLLPWIADLPQLLHDVARVLRKDGLFAFSALGPDSLRELRNAFEGDEAAHVREFADMHNLGDTLVREGLRDPVLDIDHLHLEYTDTRALFRDLTVTGARNTLAGRRRTLTGKQRFGRVKDALQSQFHEQRLRLTLEMVYGHAWGGGPLPKDGEFSFSVDDLRGRRRGR